jgi:transcriptional regulator with XRE-family HTH domain
VTLKGQRPLPSAYPKPLKTLGDHLRKKRLDLKLLQKDVARKLGVDKTSIHNWERGHTTPSLCFVPRIKNFLGYNPFEKEAASLGDRIKAYRRSLGLSRKALAKQMKIDPTTLARWERGRGRPSKEFLGMLVSFFESFRVSPALR